MNGSQPSTLQAEAPGPSAAARPQTPAEEALPSPPPRRGPGWLPGASSIALALAGAGAMIALWQALAWLRHDLPGPLKVLAELRALLGAGFSQSGSNDKGVYLRLATSLRKVFTGFGIAALVGIPLGFAIGAVKTVWRALNPLVQVLRPVSPLAWFPIALVLFKDAGRASIFTISVTALWPVVINTAAGVGGIPQDHRNVARVFRFSRSKYVRHVLLPYSMSSILTGLRLSMGIAWMVIVATEMLSGSTGIGFFVWDSYNNNNLAAVVAAMILIGVVGFGLDLFFSRLARRFDYSGAAA